MCCEECHGEGWLWVDHIPAYGVMPGDPDRPPRSAPRSLQYRCPCCGGSGQRAHDRGEDLWIE